MFRLQTFWVAMLRVPETASDNDVWQHLRSSIGNEVDSAGLATFRVPFSISSNCYRPSLGRPQLATRQWQFYPATSRQQPERASTRCVGRSQWRCGYASCSLDNALSSGTVPLLPGLPTGPLPATLRTPATRPPPPATISGQNINNDEFVAVLGRISGVNMLPRRRH